MRRLAKAAAWPVLAVAWVWFMLAFDSWWVLLPIGLAYGSAWLVSIGYGDIKTDHLR